MSLFLCKIKQKDDIVKCDVDYYFEKGNIIDCEIGEHYIVSTNKGDAKMDYQSYKKTGDTNTEISFFRINKNKVSYSIPPVSWPRIRVGDSVLGSIYGYNKQCVFIQIKENIKGVIPINYFFDFIKDVEDIPSPTLGDIVECTVIKDAHSLILSKRMIDVTGKQLKPVKDFIYLATIIDVADEVTVNIDVLQLDAYVSKNFNGNKKYEIDEGDLFPGRQVYVRFISDYFKKFVIVSLDPIHFKVEDDDRNDTFDQIDGSGDEPCFEPNEITHIEDETSHEKCSEIVHRQVVNHHKKDSDIAKLKSVVIRPYATKEKLNPQRVNELIKYLKEHEELKNVSQLSKQTRISENTLRKWHQKIKYDENWSPLLANKAPTRKAMDDLLEDSIMYYIYTRFLSKGYQFNDRMARTIALLFWEKHKTHRIMMNFKASYNWLQKFKKKYDLVNRRAHYHRRAFVTDDIAKYCHEFYEKVTNIYEEHKKNNTLYLLINVDETSWKVTNFGDLTWASKGTEHVEFSNTFNDKNSFTVIGAISADEELYKLPLCIVQKGKTNRSLKVFEQCKQYFQLDVSENGWSTTSSFANYLLWLRAELDERYKNIIGYTNNTKIDIVLDLYASHRNNDIKKLAELLNFNLLFIPPGFTDSFQPLDRYVFGCLKNMARTEFYSQYVRDPEGVFDVERACKILIDCWERVSHTHTLGFPHTSCAISPHK